MAEARLPPMGEVINFMRAFRKGIDFDAIIDKQVDEGMETLAQRIHEISRTLLGESEEARRLTETLTLRVQGMDYTSTLRSLIDHLKQVLKELKTSTDQLQVTLDSNIELFDKQQVKLQELYGAFDRLIRVIQNAPLANPYTESIAKCSLIACMVISHKMGGKQ